MVGVGTEPATGEAGSGAEETARLDKGAAILGVLAVVVATAAAATGAAGSFEIVDVGTGGFGAVGMGGATGSIGGLVDNSAVAVGGAARGAGDCTAVGFGITGTGGIVLWSAAALTPGDGGDEVVGSEADEGATGVTTGLVVGETGRAGEVAGVVVGVGADETVLAGGGFTLAGCGAGLDTIGAFGIVCAGRTGVTAPTPPVVVGGKITVLLDGAAEGFGVAGGTGLGSGGFAIAFVHLFWVEYPNYQYNTRPE